MYLSATHVFLQFFSYFSENSKIKFYAKVSQNRKHSAQILAFFHFHIFYLNCCLLTLNICCQYLQTFFSFPCLFICPSFCPFVCSALSLIVNCFAPLSACPCYLCLMTIQNKARNTEWVRSKRKFSCYLPFSWSLTPFILELGITFTPSDLTKISINIYPWPAL